MWFKEARGVKINRKKELDAAGTWRKRPFRMETIILRGTG